MKKALFFVAAMLLAMVSNAQEWNLVNSFATSTGRQHAVVFDGENIYTAAWGKSSTVASMFFKYDLEGNLLDEFDVNFTGSSNSDNYMRDMTFDGTYFYGCDAHSGKIWCYDLHNKTLVGTIETSLNELGTCTYDPVNDAFWVGERASGSGTLYLDLKLVNRSGQVIQAATAADLNGHTVHGTGYYVDDNGGRHLLLNAVQGFTDHVYDYNIDSDVLSSDFFDFSVTPGWGAACSAGGAYVGTVDGTQYFFGDVDKSPNIIGIYALGEYTPVVPTPPEGDIFFDFEDGIMRWNTIDGDEDGFNWEMRAIYAVPGNTHCVTSASFDDWTQTVLMPENYLVTPYKLDCEQITFKAQAQDASHPNEHFGVAVSTTEGASSEDFEIVWESDLTAKTAGAWYDFDVDLRAYQGQDIYVAIVHFNCTNQFSINVDDITLHRVFDGVSENDAKMFRTYPNPVSDIVMVESESVVDSYEVYNMAGAMISSANVGSSEFGIDMRELPAGVYVVKMNAEGVVMTRRIVKR
ncbi:MAG: choice-of-anchor J domain-containing protein [Bacteroidales bacterium]|nr:choice-of-anchor J domain-containing protein [Bacteroidales bacterium]